MNAFERRPLRAVALAGLGLLAAACSRPEDVPATPVAEAPAAEPTAIRRLEPTPTPTLDPAADPLAPIELEALPGVPVPIGARVVEVVTATAESDARVDFALPEGTTTEAMTAWFRERMPEMGWEESDERDGAVIFLHTEQLSARHAGEGIERTAMVLFDTLSDEADFTVLAEAAKP